MFLKEPIARESKLNQNKENKSFQISKLSDKAVIIEDEQKFREYFLKEMKKVERKVYMCPVSKDFELFLNKEIIEDNQEMIIEKEDRVFAPLIPDQNHLNVERTRRTKLVQEIKKEQNYEKIGGWFLNGLKLIGIKGGVDQALVKIPETGKKLDSQSTDELGDFILNRLFDLDLDEILQKIFLFLDPFSLKNCRCVCHLWNDFITKRVWHSPVGRRQLQNRLIYQWKHSEPLKTEYRTDRLTNFLVCDDRIIVCGGRHGEARVYDIETGDLKY